jgi:hypothetical protein
MVEIFKDNVRRGQRGVTAEVDLMQRGEPAQLITLIGTTKKAVSDWLCCWAILSSVSSGNHSVSGHRGGITAKIAIAEGIYQVKLNFLHHNLPFLLSST